MKEIAISHIIIVVDFFIFDPGAGKSPKCVLSVIICTFKVFLDSMGQNQKIDDSSMCVVTISFI